MRGFVILARMSAAHKSWGSYLDNSRMNNAIGKLDAFPIEVDLIQIETEKFESHPGMDDSCHTDQPITAM